jgi:F-type H+-transporting ATPase subunit epsilon
VSILSQHAELSHEIDVAAARAVVESGSAEDDEEGAARVRHAEARVRAAERAS